MKPYNGLANRSPDSVSNCVEESYEVTPERLVTALGAFAAEIAPVAPDLSAILSAWMGLPDALKAGIVAMVNAAKVTQMHDGLP